MKTMMSNPASAQKVALREELRGRLDGLAPKQAFASAVAIAERVLALPEVAEARGILTCLSFGHEVDTWSLIDPLRARGQKVYVPRADPRDGQLHVHPYPCVLRTLSFGLQQPPRGTLEVEKAEIDSVVDVVLVLGLGFDRDGYRLGYGSGYFDRFFAAHPLLAIGLAYDLQLLDTVPREAHDVPMAGVVTESEVCRPFAVPPKRA